MVQYGRVRYGTVWYGTVRYGTNTVRHGMVWYGTDCRLFCLTVTHPAVFMDITSGNKEAAGWKKAKWKCYVIWLKSQRGAKG
jgi:hypothetical protein